MVGWAVQEVRGAEDLCSGVGFGRRLRKKNSQQIEKAEMYGGLIKTGMDLEGKYLRVECGYEIADGGTKWQNWHGSI